MVSKNVFFAISALVLLAGQTASACQGGGCGGNLHGGSVSVSVNVNVSVRTQSYYGGGCGGSYSCGGGCSSGGCGGGYYGGGYGYFGATNPAGRGYYGVGRFPLRAFATPLRPWGGLTPVRQFAFGRGRERRLNRRAVLFGA